MAGPILYIAEVDYAAEHHPRFEAWYANRHAPDLFRLGSRTVSSYRPTVGGLAVLNVYEFADSAMLRTARYKAINASDPYGADVRATSAGQSRYQTLYQERTAVPGETQDRLPTIDADWISLARFNAPEALDAAIAEWVTREGQALLAGHGATKLRFATRIPETVGAGSDRPRCVLFVEWTSEPPSAADLDAALARRFGGEVKDSLPFVGWRTYPWPNARPEGR
jgi:hypothetical protein